RRLRDTSPIFMAGLPNGLVFILLNAIDRPHRTRLLCRPRSTELIANLGKNRTRPRTEFGPLLHGASYSPHNAAMSLPSPADLLLTATRPKALARLGLSWTQLQERLPRLSQVAIVGYPVPRHDVPGHDLTYQAQAGLVEPPALPRACTADWGGAQEVVIAAL